MPQIERVVPKRVRDFIRASRLFRRGWRYLRSDPLANAPKRDLPPDPDNPLRRYAAALGPGPGLWKWDHYFEAYHRHFAKFRGREVHVVEIGVLGGGSLRMWRDYFGPNAKIYGIDIDPACAAYADDRVKIFIADQSDREFWRRFRAEVPVVHVVIDDGSHFWGHQIPPCEELLPHLAPGGVYLCEDICGVFNGMSLYLNAYLQELNEARWRKRPPRPGEPELACAATNFQRAVASVHFYPFVAVIERHDRPQAELFAVKQGSEFPAQAG